MNIHPRDAVVKTQQWYRLINGKIFKFTIVEYPRAVNFRVSEEFTRGLMTGPSPISRHNFWVYKDNKKRSR